MILSVIIVSYNTKDLTLQTIDSVFQDIKHSSLLSKQTELIIIDNHSSDGSIEALEKMGSIHLIKNKSNVGFATANNQGITQSTGSYILLLNSDTVVQPGCLEKLVHAFTSHPIDDTTSTLSSVDKPTDRLGVLAANLLNPDHSPQPQGGNLPTLGSVGMHMLMIDDLPVVGKWLPSTQHTGYRSALNHSTKKLHSQGWVGATAMMIRRQVLEEIGPLDQNIFMYGEDIEFCIRACHHHWDIAVNPVATVIHYGSASSSSEKALIGEFTGYLYIWAKHKPMWQIPILKTILKLGAYLRIIVFGTMKHEPAKVSVYRHILSEALRK